MATNLDTCVDCKDTFHRVGTALRNRFEDFQGHPPITTLHSGKPFRKYRLPIYRDAPA